MKGPRLYLGIDPGLSGGIAALDGTGRAVFTYPMPDTEKDVFDVFQPLADMTLDETGRNQIAAVLERVGASPQMGVTSAFTFGKGYGALRMALLAVGIPFTDVTPNVWQKAMGISQRTGARSLGASPKKNKNIAKAKAQQLFPNVKVTHSIADALLIAEHCRRTALGLHSHAA